MTDAAALLSARKAYVVAPAGCGKTHLIAETVSLDAERRSLILTHTHAGVDALRNKLKKLGAKSASYRVDTIAGWSLRLATSFPGKSGISTQRPVNEQWDEVYQSVVGLLDILAIKKVVCASFDSVYVDEYQDCSPNQHNIILKLVEILPTRILGDPLQGIFKFRGSSIIDWETNIKPNFDELEPLGTPHRWKGKNTELGKWLLDIRPKLEANEPIDLRQAPAGTVKYVELPSLNKSHTDFQRKYCVGARCADGETLVAIHEWERQCHALARLTGGLFRSPETMECDDLFQAVKRLDAASDGIALAKATFEFADLCLTKVKTGLKGQAEKIFNSQNLQQGRAYRLQKQIDALKNVIEKKSFVSVKIALQTLSLVPGASKARFELFGEMINALKEHESGNYRSLEEAAILTRDKTRRIGRSHGRYVISRTLLVKGLEFDHVIILDANSYDNKNLYVALTRGSSSLTVLAASPILNNKPRGVVQIRTQGGIVP